MPSFSSCSLHGARLCLICNPPEPPQRDLTRAEKNAMHNFPRWALHAPMTVDASIPVGSIADFRDLEEP